MTEQEMIDRIALLEESVRMLNNLWTKEFARHNETQMKLMELQKRILGIK